MRHERRSTSVEVAASLVRSKMSSDIAKSIQKMRSIKEHDGNTSEIRNRNAPTGCGILLEAPNVDDGAAATVSGTIYCRTSESESVSFTSVHCYGLLELVKAFSFAEASLSGPYPPATLLKRKAPNYDVDVDKEAEESVLPPSFSTFIEFTANMS